jgi:hypothetical protein
MMLAVEPTTKRKQRCKSATPTALRVARHKKRSEDGRAVIAISVNTTTIQDLLVAEQLLSEHIDYELADAKTRAAARVAWGLGLAVCST